MVINLRNNVTGTGLNLVTNPILKSSAINPVNIGVKTPVNQYKTEDPRYANKTQVNTQVKTPVTQTTTAPMSVNPKYQTNQTTVPVQTNTNQSRFIGFQNNNLGVQSKFTQDMQNITQGKTNLTDLIKARTENNKNKKYLEIPTQAKAIKQYNQDQEQRYRTNEKAIEDFHYDVLKFNGKMTADQISQYYPEFKGKENQALELQKALLPYVLDNEFASMEAITQNFPDLLPAKQQANTTEDEAKATAKKIDSENKKHFDRIKNINQNTLSYNGKEFANFMIELSNVPYQIKKNYKVDSAVTDEEIIAYVLNNFPEYKEEYERIQNLQLSDQDKARLGIGGNWLNKFSVGVANAVNAANNWYKNNVQNTLSDVPIVGSIANIPGGVIGGFNKMLQAGGELTNGEFESAGQIASSGIKAIGGGVESVFNTALAPITAAFNVAGETELGKKVEENTLGLAQDGITAFYEKTPIIKSFYNSLDDEAKADLVNETMLALFHGLGKGIKKTGLDVKAGVATDAITNALQRGKYASKFQIWVEKGLADENGKFSDGALKRIVGEGTKEVESALKENFSRFNEVVEARKQARDFKQAPVDNTNLEDQRSTTEKVKSEINKATDIVKEKASEVGNEIKEKATEIKNKITTKKEVKPVEETESQGIIDKISDYGAKKITGTVSAQDKLYKAQEPRMNVLSNRRNLEQRRANSDRANELIVENGYTPTDTTTRLKAHEDTMRNIWSEIESRINKSDLLVDKTALSDVLDEYVAEQEKLGSTLNQKEINALRQEAQLLRGKVTDLMTLEKQKQLYNSVINNWGDQKVSDTLANGLRRVTKEIGRLEDIILGKVPGEFSQLKKDFGALKDTYEDVFKADMKNQRKKGLGLTETYSRIEGFGDLIEGVFGLLSGNGAKVVKGAGKILLGKSLAKASNNDFLIKEGFKELSDKIKAKGGDKSDNTPPKKPNTPPKKPNNGGNEPKNKITSKKQQDNNRLEYKEQPKEESKPQAKEQPKNVQEKKGLPASKEESKKVETRSNVTKKEKAPSTKNKPIQPTVNKSIENIDDFKREIIDKRDTNMKVAMLNRMKSDIDYIVNNNLGEGGYKFLRATGNPEKHIEYMKALYDSIPENERPDINIKDYANKLGVSLKESESKNTGGIKRQTGDSRAAKFTNTIMDIIDSNGGLKDGYLKVKRDALEPLYIEDIGGGKIAIGQTYIQEGDVMFDPEIVFGLDENGRLQAETFRNDSMGIYEQPIKSNDPFLETWEATLKDFIKKEEPKTATEITGEKNTVTAKTAPSNEPKNKVTSDQELPTIKLDDIKNAKSYDDLMNLFNKSTHDGRIPRLDDRIQYKNINYVGKVGDKDVWIWGHDNRTAIAIGKGLKKTEGVDNLGYERPTPIDFKTVFTVDDIKNEIQKAQSLDNQQNRNIIGQNNTLTTKSINNGGKELQTTNGGASQGLQGENGQVSRIKTASGEQMNDSKGDSGIMRKDQPDNESILKGQSAGPAIGGVSKNLTRSEARAINQSSKDILSKHDYSTNPSDYTKEELDTLRKYEGAGGLTNKGEDTTGVLDQFYTPQTAIDAVWNLVDKYKNSKDNYTVLEPTVGTGRFIRDRKNEKYEGHEIDKTPGTIAQLLHPNADIHIGDFENQFMDFTGRRPQDFGRRVDIVVGNPPYSNRQTPQQKNGLEPKIKRSEEFFIKKGIDILNDGGTLAMVVPSTFLSNPMDYAKGEILKQATLVDAYRLPEGVFPYTNVGTDIIVFKKDNNGSSSISDNKWFEEHPEKVLGEVKERINRYGNLEKYVDGGDRPLDKLNLIYEDPTTTGITPEKQAENYAPITTIESTPVKEKPQTMNNITGGEKTKVTSTQKKRRTNKASKIDNQTIIKGDKSDLSDSVFGNGESNPKLLEYARFTNVDGYVDINSWRGKAAEFVKTDPENLNYYKGHAYTNDLYFAGDIYEKLEQLEKDYNLTEKGTITPEQYKKQKEGLEAVLPEPYTISNPPFVSPLDQNIMNIETSEIGNVWDSKQLKYVDKNLPLRDVFLDWFRNNVSSSTMNKELAREYLNGESMRSGSSRKGSLSDEEEKARKRHEKSVVMEQTNKIFNDWVWTKLDKDTQKKILDKFNRENRSYVVPKYGEMPLSTHNISKTFMGDKFEPKNGQVEGINFLLSKGAGIVAHGVGHGKTIEGVISTREAQLRGWNKRPLIVAPGPTLYAQRARTIKELYPDREIVNLGGLTTADIARLRNELGPDPRDWIKDGQVAIISMNGFGDNIEFRPSTQIMLEQKLKDVMETKDMNVRQEESMKKKIEKILAPGKGKDGVKHMYSFNGDFMREMYDSLFTRSHDEFIKHFTEQAKEERAKIPGGESITDDMINIDAEALWLEKPILLEDLGIDHLTVDEMHNFKNVFTSAKMNEKENGKKEVNRYGGIIQGNSSARGRKMFLATQYVMEKNNNRNVFGFTATPFNNQPIEIYNMLSFVGKNELEKMGVTNINDFFSRFAEFKEGLAPKASGTELEYKFIMKNFANARDLQRLITQFVNYKGDSTELIKPEKKLRTPILKMSDLQEEVQQEMELLALNKDNKGDILKATNGMISNLVSPFIVSGVRSPYGWEDFLDNSPKLKYFADVLKALRDSGKQDGMFIYMPVGQEFHELYREALANYTNTPKEKIGIIDSKTSSKKDEIAEKFRSGEFNVLIGGKNTAEGIDLQNNGYITAIASVDWNPTVRTQVDGRVRRQGNFNNEVLSLVPLVENSADVIFMGKADQKGSRINNALEEMLFGGDGDLSPEEMMMSLMTRPDKKAKTQINIEKQDVDKEIYGINTQKDRLEEIKRKVIDAQNNVDEIQKKIESSKQSGYSWEIPSLKDKLKNTVKAQDRLKNYVEKNGEVPSIEEIDKDVAELVKQVEGLEERKSELNNAEDNGILDNLIKDITKEQQENAKNVKTYQQYIEDIKEDIKTAKRFGSKKELKEYLENKRNLLSNDKNRVTSK